MMLHVKVVNYQHNFAPHWRYDFIMPVFKIVVIFRIVGRNDGADDLFENLFVCTCRCPRRIYNGKEELMQQWQLRVTHSVFAILL